jgi:hypothetical protein
MRSRYPPRRRERVISSNGVTQSEAVERLHRGRHRPSYSTCACTCSPAAPVCVGVGVGVGVLAPALSKAQARTGP